MKRILLNVDYTDDTKKFWSESCIKNKIIKLEDNINIHDLIAETLMDKDYMTVLYKNKPRGNVYIDDTDGNAKAIGYIYRVKTEIEGKKAVFDAWVTIKEVVDYSIIDLN